MRRKGRERDGCTVCLNIKEVPYDTTLLRAAAGIFTIVFPLVSARFTAHWQLLFLSFVFVFTIVCPFVLSIYATVSSCPGRKVIVVHFN